MSEAATSKAEWLDRIERARSTWEALVSEVGDNRMNQRGATGDWTFKDVAAHLNGWRELTVSRLESAAGDKAAPRTPWPDVMSEETEEGTDEINGWFFARDHDRPASDILAETREQFQRIRAAIEAIPEADLDTRYPWLEGHPISAVIEGTLEHLHVDHKPEIRAWLADQPR